MAELQPVLRSIGMIEM